MENVISRMKLGLHCKCLQSFVNDVQYSGFLVPRMCFRCTSASLEPREASLAKLKLLSELDIWGGWLVSHMLSKIP